MECRSGGAAAGPAARLRVRLSAPVVLAHGMRGGVVEHGLVLDQAMTDLQALKQVEIALAQAVERRQVGQDRGCAASAPALGASAVRLWHTGAFVAPEDSR